MFNIRWKWKENNQVVFGRGIVVAVRMLHCLLTLWSRSHFWSPSWYCHSASETLHNFQLILPGHNLSIRSLIKIVYVFTTLDELEYFNCIPYICTDTMPTRVMFSMFKTFDAFDWDLVLTGLWPLFSFEVLVFGLGDLVSVDFDWVLVSVDFCLGDFDLGLCTLGVVVVVLWGIAFTGVQVGQGLDRWVVSWLLVWSDYGELLNIGAMRDDEWEMMSERWWVWG